MRRRLVALLRARFSSTADGGLPWAAIIMQFLVAGVLCGLVNDALGPYPYAVFSLAVAGLLVAVPLFGEAGALLFADEARVWITSLPVRPLEIRLARRLFAVFVLCVLCLGSALPAACFAPESFSLTDRALLVGVTLAQTLALGGFLLALLGLLGGRANGILVALQTAIFMLLVVGSLLGLRKVLELGALSGFDELPPAARALPPAWFAFPFDASDAAHPALLAGLALALTVAALVLAPAPRIDAAQRGGRLLAAALWPLRRLASRTWVRPRERASFEFVFDALPKEPEFALRTYPLLGIPLAFLFVGAKDATGPAREALFALLLFTPAAYLPLLLTQLPASRSHRARWLFDTAPADAASLANGSFKALCTRFVVPLWIVLGLFCAASADAGLALRWTAPALLFALFVLRRSFGVAAHEPPLSQSPEELQSDNTIFSSMLAFGLLATFAAVGAAKFLTTPGSALGATLILVLLELASDRAWTRAGLEDRTRTSSD